MQIDIQETIEKIKQHPKLIFVDDYEIVYEKSEIEAHSFSNGIQKVQSNILQSWISLRILHRKQPGRAICTKGDPLTLNHLVEQAFYSADLSGVDPWFRFPKWKALREVAIDLPQFQYQSLFPLVSERGHELEEKYEIEKKQIFRKRKSEKFTLQTHQVKHLAKVVLHKQEAPQYKYIIERGSAVPLLSKDILGHSFLSKLDPGFFQAVPVIRQGRALFSPEAMISLLKIVANYFCADTVQNFQKSFSPEIGKKIASNLISITDESQSREGFNSCAVDLEGSPAQKKKVVEKGNLTSFLYDTYTATKENRLTTANFFRKSRKIKR